MSAPKKENPVTACMRTYLAAKNAERRADRKARGVCVDCEADSDGKTRCLSCRGIQSAKEKERRKERAS